MDDVHVEGPARSARARRRDGSGRAGQLERVRVPVHHPVRMDSRRAVVSLGHRTSSSGDCGNACAPCPPPATPPPPRRSCDDVWLPHFELVNARGMSQDRVVRYGVRMQDDTDAVAWWAHVQGEFYTPMSFKAFPFDRQYLVVQARVGGAREGGRAAGRWQLLSRACRFSTHACPPLQLEYGDKFNYSNIIITPSATSLQLYQPQSGDDISGWTLQSVELQTFDLEQQNFLDEGGES